MTFWKFLVEHTKLTDSLCISYDELLQWPTDQVEEAKQQGCLVQIDDAEGIICQQCQKHCWKEVEIKQNNGQSIGSYLCEDEDNSGIITIDINRLQQWKIDKKRLWKQVFSFDSEWRVPWDDNNSEYISLQEAVNLASNDSITVRNMSRMLEGPEFPIHRMHKGRRCNVKIADFKKWLQSAQYGKITDKAIENYLERIEVRKKTAKKRKQKRNFVEPDR